METGTEQAQLTGHESTVVAVGFNRAGTLLATAGWDNTFRLWDAHLGRQLLIALGTSSQLIFSRDDRCLAYVVQGGRVGCMEVDPSAELKLLQPRGKGHDGVWGLGFSPDNRLLATGHKDGFALWDAVTGAEIAFAPAGECRMARFTPDGRSVITSGASGLAQWPLTLTPGENTDEARLGLRIGLRDGLQFLEGDISTDGRWVAAANRLAAAASIYEVANPSNRFALRPHVNIQYLSLSPDGRWLASGTWQGTGVKIWNLHTRQLECDLPVQGAASVLFSPDGRWLVTGSRLYHVWRVDTWQEACRMVRPDPEESIGRAAFSPDSRWLAVRVEGSSVRLLETASGRELAALESPRQPRLHALAFSPDGTKLMAMQLDQQLQLWDLQRIRAGLRALRLDWPGPDPSAAPGLAATVGRASHPLRATLAPFSPADLARRIPARGTNAPPASMDLSAHFNAPLDETWHTEAGPGNDLRELPRGVHEFAGVPFDVRGVVQLAIRDWPGRYPTNAPAIVVNRHCRRLHFLHGTGWYAREGALIGRYILHFADGHQAEQPILYGEDVRDWWLWQGDPKEETARSTVAWVGTSPATAAKGYSLRIFKSSWDNPDPGAVVAWIDFETALTYAAPFLLAITAE